MAFLTDILRGRIPNLLIAVGFISGLVYLIADHSAAEICKRILASVLIFGLLFLFYAIGTMGAGDIKLLMMISMYVDIVNYGQILMACLMVAAVMSLYKLVRDGSLISRMMYFFTYVQACLTGGELKEYYDGDTQERLTIPLAASVFLGYTCWLAASKLL